MIYSKAFTLENIYKQIVISNLLIKCLFYDMAFSMKLLDDLIDESEFFEMLQPFQKMIVANKINKG